MTVSGKWKCWFIPTYVGNRAFPLIFKPFTTVHPHVRGEQLWMTKCRKCLGGSSPRTWGTVRAERADLGNGRFIPTYVGNRCRLRFTASPFPVHPHVRGEQQIVNCDLFFDPGSSPRTWGTDSPMIIQVPPERFIPTYVGNSASFRLIPAFSAVHPHVRGEQ